MTGRTRRAGLTLVAATLLAGCGGGATPVVHRGDVHEVALGSVSAQDVAAAQTAFGVDLLHVLCAQAPGENLLVSPTSAAEVLGLLQPAAGGETATALAGLLHLPDWSPDLVAAVRDHTAALDGLRYEGDLDDEDAPDSLQMSNRLWTAPDVEPDADYLDDIATAFDADVRALDFAGDPDGATERINTTVEEDTRGIIEELFADPLPSDTRLVLTNALHLKARWLTPFSPDSPEATFRAPSGEVSVPMMGGAEGTFRAAEGWQSVELPYVDGTLAAVAVLPPEGTDPCAVEATVLGALDAGDPATAAIRLPRLTIEQSHSLLGPLTELGLPVEGTYPAFGDGGLTITQIVQKTFLLVDEEGTEAAAATGGALAGSAAPVPEIVTFDRPFLFLLTDTETRSPLFVTVVNDPSA
jgi:serpin B